MDPGPWCMAWQLDQSRPLDQCHISPFFSLIPQSLSSRLLCSTVRKKERKNEEEEEETPNIFLFESQEKESPVALFYAIRLDS